MGHFIVTEKRLLKAKKIESILVDYTGDKIENKKILDIGCGNGEIAWYFLESGNEVHCVDIEDQRNNRENCIFKKVDSEILPYTDNFFDIVFSNHIIEHVGDGALHLSEIRRVLRDNGLCYLATPNRYFPFEIHYRVFLLHWLPNPIFLWLLKKINKFEEDLHLFGYSKLKRTIKKIFFYKEYTHLIAKNPEKFYSTDMVPKSMRGKNLKFLNWISPTNVFVLLKKKGSSMIGNYYILFKRAIGKILPKKVIKFIVDNIMPVFRPIEHKMVKKIEYSQQYYDDNYHTQKGALDKRSFIQVMDFWEKQGFKDELFTVLKQIDIPGDRKLDWLEIACMHGKTVWWIAEKYSNIFFYMFDFSQIAINWVSKNNPIPDRTIVWTGDIVDIRNEENRFEKFFDFISCIDVTEHLPKEIYHQGIKEMYRVLKPGGYLILKQGISVSPEHINVLTEEQLVTDFTNAGFIFVNDLPRRYHLFTKK